MYSYQRYKQSFPIGVSGLTTRQMASECFRRRTEVGDVTIDDDGNEATIYIGEITHGHFNPYDETLSEKEIAERVTSDVVDFLDDLFADRVLLWKSPDSGSGGWRLIGQDNPYSLKDRDDITYLWSGPVKNPDSNAG